MQPDNYSEPVRYPRPSHRGAAWLNGATWMLFMLCPLLAVLLHARDSDSMVATIPLLFLLPVAALGALINLLLALWYGIRGRGQLAGPYLLGFLLLLLCLVGQIEFYKVHPLIGKFQ